MDVEDATDTEAPLSLPDSTALLKHEQRKKRGAAVGAVIAVTALGIGGYFAVASMGDGMKEVGQAYDALNTCMMGEPLKEGETVAVRMSGIELALHTMTASERAERGADWPNECKVHAHKLAEAATTTGKADALAEASRKLAGVLETPGQDTPTKAYTEVVTAADALKLAPKIADMVRRPPEASPRPTVDALPATARLSEDGFNPGHLHLEPFQSRDVYFLMDEENLPGGPQLCDYRPANKELVCTALPKRVAKKSPHLRLWGTTDPEGAPFLYVGDRGKDGIYRSSDGKKIGKKMIYGANAKKDGTLVATVWSTKDEELKLAELRRGEKKPTSEKLLAYEQSGNPYYHTGLFWNWFVYRDFDEETKELHLYARRIDGVGKWGKLIDVGPIFEPSKIVKDDPPHLDACRDGDMIVVRARGLHADRLAFYDGSKWHPPVESVGLAGDLTCFGGEAVVTLRAGKYIRQNRCKPAGCEGATFDLKKVLRERKSMHPATEDPVEAAAVGASLAVAWRAPSEGLRIIVGDPAKIDKTMGKLVLDQTIHEGKVSMTPTVLHYRLIPGRGYALLVTSTISGNYVHEVRPDGAIVPVTVKRVTAED